MTGNKLAQLAERQPAHLQMLVAQHDTVAANQAAGERHNAHQSVRQHLEQVVIERHTGFDQQTGFLTHLALQRRAIVLARIGPAAGQIPFTAFVQEQQHAGIMDQHAFDGDGGSGHDDTIAKGPEIALRPFRNFEDDWT